VRAIRSGFTYVHIATRRNAVQRETFPPRGFEFLGGSRVRLTAPRICHCGHLALGKLRRPLDCLWRSGQSACQPWSMVLPVVDSLFVAIFSPTIEKIPVCYRTSVFRPLWILINLLKKFCSFILLSSGDDLKFKLEQNPLEI
jgi:hypothetical protein